MDRTLETTATRPGVAEQPRARGADEAPEDRPGVPMEAEPSPAEGAHWDDPARQDSDVTHLHRESIDELTPVYGTAQPPRGISGLMRRAAYRIPEHRARRWSLLLAADRVDVLESKLGEALGRPLDSAGLGDAARRIQHNPAAMLLTATVVGYALRKALR